MLYHGNRATLGLMLLLGIVSGCRKPVVHKIEGADKTNNDPAKEVASPSKPVQPARPNLFRFNAGERLLFKVSISAALQGPADEMMQKVGLVSKVAVVSVEQRRNEDLVLAMLQSPELRIEKDPKPTDENLRVLRMELLQPVWGRYLDGKLTKLYFPPKPSAYAADVWRSILTAMQIAVPLDGDNPFETTEFDNNGECRVSYRKIAEETWTKKKLSYLKGLRAIDRKNTVGSAPAPRVVGSEGEIWASLQLKKIVQKDIIELSPADNSGLKCESRLEMVLVESTPISPNAQLMPSGKALVLNADELYLQELSKADVDRERIEGLTFPEVLRAWATRSQDARKKEGLSAEKNEQEAKIKDKQVVEPLKLLDKEDARMMDAVRPQLYEWLESLPNDTREMLGFSNRPDLTRPVLGLPYKRFHVDPDGTIRSMEYWRIPVLIDGEYCAVFDVKKENGKYEGYSLGSKDFAKDIASMETRVAGRYEVISKRSLIVDSRNSAGFAVFNTKLENIQNEKGVEIYPFPSATGAFFDEIKTIVLSKTNNIKMLTHATLTFEEFESLYKK
jgi:hypothetical protein